MQSNQTRSPKSCFLQALKVGLSHQSGSHHPWRKWRKSVFQHKQTNKQLNAYTYIHTCMHACMHTYIHTYIHIYMAYTHTYMYVFIYTLFLDDAGFIYIINCKSSSQRKLRWASLRTVRLWQPQMSWGLLGPSHTERSRILIAGSLNLSTQRLLSSSFLVMTYFLLKNYNIQPKRELLWSLWVVIAHLEGP